MSKLTKAEFVKGVAASVDGISVKDTEAVIDATFGFIAEQVAAGHTISVPKFGTFEAKKRNARIGHNPKTKETIEIPATVVPVWRASAAFKNQLK